MSLVPLSVPETATETVAACLSALEKNPRNGKIWENLLYCLVAEGRPQDIWAALPLMPQYDVNRVESFVNACSRLAEAEYDLNIITHRSPDVLGRGLLAIVQLFIGRMAYLRDYDLSGACVAYENGVRLYPFGAKISGMVKEQELLQNFFMIHGLSPLFALKPPSYSQDTSFIEPVLNWSSLPDLANRKQMIIASADDSYCQIYGERLLESVQKYCPDIPCLFHVMNPTPEGDAKRSLWQERFPQLVVISENTPRDIPYYAARRFMILNEARRAYGRDVLLIDMDGYVETAMPNLLKRLVGQELGFVFRTPEPLDVSSPNVLYNASIAGCCLYVAAMSPLADQFFDRTCGYLAHKIEDDTVFWCWDESALCHALCCLDSTQRESIVNLTVWEPDIMTKGIAAGNLHEKNQNHSRDMTSDRGFAQRNLAQILGQVFDPATTPKPFHLLLQESSLPSILRKVS